MHLGVKQETGETDNKKEGGQAQEKQGKLKNKWQWTASLGIWQATWSRQVCNRGHRMDPVQKGQSSYWPVARHGRPFRFFGRADIGNCI